MNSTWVRVGAPMLAWLDDSDAGTWLGEVGTGVPPEHRVECPFDEDTMDVLARMWNADRRRDGSVRIELAGRVAAEALREWAGHVDYFATQNAGHDASERGMMNSARALLRAVDDFLRVAS